MSRGLFFHALPLTNAVILPLISAADGSDAFTLGYNGTNSAAIVHGANYSAAGIAAALQGPSEVQTVSLTGYDDSDTYTLDYKGADSAPIVRGQNNTAAGIQNALQGGNEQQQVTLGSFSSATQSFQISLNGNTSPVFGAGGTTVSNANIAAAITSLMCGEAYRTSAKISASRNPSLWSTSARSRAESLDPNRRHSEGWAPRPIRPRSWCSCEIP